ncbi:hypothetical protein [Synechococcus sp. MIT S1220]|uniref:hypothetical protein n=1 Tax=Synechococcus sp. MIT S1220 TaxID=3082549 RepID=UPI0039AF41A5
MINPYTPWRPVPAHTAGAPLSELTGPWGVGWFVKAAANLWAPLEAGASTAIEQLGTAAELGAG